MGMNIHDAINFLHRIDVNGPQPAQYALVTKAVEALSKHDLADREMIERLLIKPSTEDGIRFNLMEHIFSRPYGYAGDFALMAKFYTAYDLYHVMWSEQGRVPSIQATRWDQYILSRASGMCLYYREQYLLNYIGKLVEEKKVTKVLDIACGNGRLIKKLAVKYPHCIFEGIDTETAAIREALDDRPNNCAFSVMNALAILPNAQYDLVVSAGLCDYLNDKHLTRLVRRIQLRHNPKYMVIGNMTNHDSEALMKILDWELIYRTSTDLFSLVISSFLDKKVYVDKEPMGVNLFLHIEPKEE